jgi:ribose 5-phosphate isomerase A
MQTNLKQMAGEYAVSYVEDGMVVGLGTGSTVAYTIKKLAGKVAEGLDIVGIPTSKETEILAGSLGVKLASLNECPVVDITIDGADEVDPNLDLIKGMGGALLREKIVARASKTEVIVADDSKLVRVLGSKSPLPVEVAPFGWQTVKGKVEKLGCTAVLREREGNPYSTDNGNLILDCRFQSIEEPAKLEKELNSITGVVENGLFLGIADKVIVASEKGVKELNRV